ncbi:hypothetical protein SANTM175S_03334 [Streptomyces antimycoticus]
MVWWKKWISSEAPLARTPRSVSSSRDDRTRAGSYGHEGRGPPCAEVSRSTSSSRDSSVRPADISTTAIAPVSEERSSGAVALWLP